MLSKSREPKYYIRVFKDDDWFVLWRLVWQRDTRIYQPIWRHQDALGSDVPHLYKTLVGARNAIDKIAPKDAFTTVAVWGEKNGIAQTTSH